MPRPLSYTPEWLSRPSPGFDFLSSSGKSTSSTTSSTNKRLANRGSELFFATGTELRWGDLILLESASNDDHTSTRGWRNLKVPVTHAIERLSISPDGSLLAIITKHTCHVCVLPAPSHLRSGETSPLRVRTFQIGPTAHVLEQAPLTTCLWHPLSSAGLQCLITVTVDACIRLWELDLNNRYSFDQPGLAVDLKKLANATTTLSDFSASKFGANRGFSPDDVEMEVAAACFGGQGSGNEHGWSSMTLWLAMVEGDVYALCPLLPSRFSLPVDLMPSLTTSVTAEAQILATDAESSDAEKHVSQCQIAWLSELDSQEPLQIISEDGLDVVEVYARPEKPGAIAKLQGPFQLTSDIAISNMTDIFAVAPALNDGFLFDEEDEEGTQPSELLSIGIVCLATSTGDVHVCLSLEPVQAQWLPAKRSRSFTFDDEAESNDLLLFHTVALPHSGTSSLSFTPARSSLQEVLVTTGKGVFNLDFRSWCAALERELAGETTSGVEFRFRMLLGSTSTEVEPLITAASADDLAGLIAAVVLDDANLGHFVLTTTRTGPRAATLETAIDSTHSYEPQLLALPAPELRESYQSHPDFFHASELGNVFAAHRANPVIKSLLAQPVRSKPETLQMLTNAHRVLSHETNRLGIAAAELFRRCERMCVELADQVARVNDISQKVTSLTTDETIDLEAEDDDADDSKEAQIDQRIMKMQSDTTNMNERLERLRRNMLRLGGEDLSTKERAFANEVWHLQDMVNDREIPAPVDSMSIVKMPDSMASLESSIEREDLHKGPLTIRLQHAEQVSKGLTDKAEEYVTKHEQDGTDIKRTHVNDNEYKKQKLGRVMQLLERENALMEAVTERLGRLGGLA